MKTLTSSLVLGLFVLTSCAHSQKTSTETSSNQLEALTKLNNHYVVIRHGESVPSSEKRVCGSMEQGVDPKNKLTEKGRKEVETSIQNWAEQNQKMIRNSMKKCQFKILSSPFSRTMETAEIIQTYLSRRYKSTLPKTCPLTLQVEKDLKERSFGDFEGQLNSGTIYEKVWAEDKTNPDNHIAHVESPHEVRYRASGVIKNLDQHSVDQVYLIVSHGDTLKILQTAFQKESASFHMNPVKVMPFKTAEIRELKLKL